MNFIPPACLLDESSPVQYVPKEDKPTGIISTPKLMRKKSFVSRWNRKAPFEDVPPVPQIPTVFATPRPGTDTTLSSFSAHETDNLNYVARPGPVAEKELVVSGVSFMDLSDSSDDDEYQSPIILNKIRRARSKTDVSASDSSPAMSSLVPDPPWTDSPGLPMRIRRLTDTKVSAALRITNCTNSSAAERTSLQSGSSVSSPLSSRSGHDLSSSAPENPQLDPDFEFNEFMTSNKPQTTPSPRSESDVSRVSSNPSKSAPPIDPPRSRKYETISVQATRESVHGYASFLSKARTRGLPMPDTIDEDEGEWNRAVEWVRGQEANRIVRDAKAAKDEKKMQKSEASQTQKDADWQNKIGLARQFIGRTSTAWAPQQDSHELCTDEARRDAIAEALDLASKDHSLDPGFTELRKRFFADTLHRPSRSQDAGAPKSAPVPSRAAWMSPTRHFEYSSISSEQFARSSTAKVSQQIFPSSPVSSVGPSPFDPPQRPLPHLNPATRVNAKNGLGIQVKVPDPDTRDGVLDEGQYFVHPEPMSPNLSTLSQRNAFGPRQTPNSCSPQENPQYPDRGNDTVPASTMSSVDDSESQHRLRSSAEATLANARIFKVDRDSKIQDRWAPKRCATLYQTIDAARELAEARMGISPVGGVTSPTFPRTDSKPEVPSPTIKKVQSGPFERNVFKRAVKHPSLRAMVSSLSMQSPDATEMISSPITPTSNHPAFRSAPTTPVTPTAVGHRPSMAQQFNSAMMRPPTSTSISSDGPVLTPLSATFSKSSSQKSSVSVAAGEDRWAQRIRQKTKVEKAWQEHGVIRALVEEPQACETAGLHDTAAGKGVLSETSTQPLLQMPIPPACLPPNPTATSIFSPAIGQKLSSHLSRKTQDSPTPLEIKKFNHTPKLPLGLSLPDSPAPLQVSKVRPLVRRSLEQDFKDAPDTRNFSHSYDGDNDPFAKGGSSSKGEEKWPLSDASGKIAALEDHQALEQSPLDGQFDTIITSWRHASATQDSLPPSPSARKSIDFPGKHKHIRNHLELDVLLGPATGKTHPNHPHHWDTTNIMCKNLHNARNSNNTAITADGDDTVRFCSYCQEACCYFGLQLGRAHIQTKGRDQILEELKNKARSHVYFLRGVCPDGMEDYQILMECGLCKSTCCPSCTNICQVPMCSHPVCKECGELENGICGQQHATF